MLPTHKCGIPDAPKRIKQKRHPKTGWRFSYFLINLEGEPSAHTLRLRAAALALGLSAAASVASAAVIAARLFLALGLLLR